MAWGNFAQTQHMKVIDSQHFTDAAYSVETIQSTITSTDLFGIDQEIPGAQKFRK